MRILFLSAWCPLPADNGSKLRISHLLRGLGRTHEVDLLTFAPEHQSLAAMNELRTFCHDVELVSETPFARRKSGLIRGLFSLQPRSMVADFSELMGSAVRRRANYGYDLVIASQLHMAPYALLLPDVPRLLEEIELAIMYDHYLQQDTFRSRIRAGMTWWKLRRYVTMTLNRFVAATAVSQRELDCLQAVSPSHVQLKVIPNGVDFAACSGDFGVAQPNTLIYPGALSWNPNFDAMRYFIADILPHIQAHHPDIRLRITGRATEEQIADLPPF
ncbi:MAG: glycosyltransferase [Blastochloris sp.]|nr:glycosyltransferase [Blastochloris sp.]